MAQELADRFQLAGSCVACGLRQGAMAFFKLRTLPGYDWPPLADAALAQIWVAYLALERTQWLSADEIAQQQLDQIRHLLAHSITHVPYYREVLPRAGNVPGAVRTLDDFRRIPRLPRRTYQERFAQFAATELPPGTVATLTQQTSGSSGTPTSVLMTNLVHLWWHAFFLRDLEWSGVDPRGTLASIRSTGHRGQKLQQLLRGVHQPSWLETLDRLIVTGPTHLMDIQQDHREQLQWLRRVEPDYLLSYPANLEVLAHLVQQERRLPRLRALLAISESLAPEVQEAIETAFGVPVKNTYSCAEAGYLASPCPAGHGWHVHAENVLLEVLAPDGSPCPPGQSGQVYITHLHNLRGPLLRYELGDEATLAGVACPCGRGLPLLTGVQGKSSPLFVLPDGRRKSSIVLTRVIRKIGGHWQHQVVQKAPDHVVVRLAAGASWTAGHAEQVQAQLHAFFEAPIRVDVELHDRLPMPPHGKFQSMINELGS
jgi:phenylacetate-CoA ligase